MGELKIHALEIQARNLVLPHAEDLLVRVKAFETGRKVIWPALDGLELSSLDIKSTAFLGSEAFAVSAVLL